MSVALDRTSSGIRVRWRDAVERLAAVMRSPEEELGQPVAGGGTAVERVPAEVQLRAWSEVLGVPWVEDLRTRRVASSFVERIPIRFARQYCVVALHSDEAESSDCLLDIVIGSVGAWPVVDIVRRHLRCPMRPLLAAEDHIMAAINRAYQQRGGQSAAAVGMLDPSGEDHGATFSVQEDLLDAIHKPPVIRLVNSMLFEAIQARASDVHVQPHDEGVVVRQRIDGVLFDALAIPKAHQEEVISRLKILGRMNIAEKRLPQDGRATVEYGDRLVDLRIASLPTNSGERIVIRFLDKNAQLFTLDELGMSAHAAGDLKRLIQRDHGILLVTGPTGSGKSTTLYAALQEINSKNLNVITLEDPIEYQLKGISQTQINHKKGLTFAKGLRHVLRQDPDIIMVGEIRDQETAEMAIQSALTGHLVFSTLHTNDAASALTRLLDLRIEPYLTASSVLAVLAQRLVRKLCRRCSRRAQSGRAEFPAITEHFEAVGCPACRRTGYHGRVGIFELLVVSDAIRDLVQNRSNAQRIRAQAIQEGMTLLYNDGIRKVSEGITTIDEVVRVTALE